MATAMANLRGASVDAPAPALAAGEAPKEPSEHEKKMATMPAWRLTIEKAALEAAWARWLQNIVDDAAAKKTVRK